MAYHLAFLSNYIQKQLVIIQQARITDMYEDAIDRKSTNMPCRSAGYIAFQKPGMPLLFDEDGIDQPFPMPVGKPSYSQGSRSSIN